MKKIYVGNLPWSVDDQALAAVFEPYGTVESANVVLDRDTGRSRGFGFVEMDDGDATTAIDALQSHQLEGRTLNINEARPRKQGGGGRGGFGGGGGGGGGGGRRW